MAADQAGWSCQPLAVERSPRVAVPVHDKVLSEIGIRSHYRQLEQLGGPGTSFQVLDDGRPVEL